MPELDHANSIQSKVLTEAIREVHRVYGRNLSAFFRDVADPTSHEPSRQDVKGNLPEVQKRKQNRISTSD